MSGKAFGCVGTTIRLRSGRYFDLVDPDPAAITPGDIAGPLAKICRFGGQLPGNRLYSVAEHSVHCWREAHRLWRAGTPGEHPRFHAAVLLHDAAEAFIGDIVRPLKQLLPDYRAIEARVEAAIETRFDVSFADPRIRQIDNAVLIAEKRAIFGDDGVMWEGEETVPKLSLRLEFFLPPMAEMEFHLCLQRAGVK
jgi:uncharacterized protein